MSIFTFLWAQYWSHGLSLSHDKNYLSNRLFIGFIWVHVKLYFPISAYQEWYRHVYKIDFIFLYNEKTKQCKLCRQFREKVIIALKP